MGESGTVALFDSLTNESKRATVPDSKRATVPDSVGYARTQPEDKAIVENLDFNA